MEKKIRQSITQATTKTTAETREPRKGPPPTVPRLQSPNHLGAHATGDAVLVTAGGGGREALLRRLNRVETREPPEKRGTFTEA